MDVGIDLVAVARIEQILADPVLVRKFFSNQEITDNLESLAGILAAKEAYMKAHGKKLDWLSIEIRKSDSGKPYIVDKPNAHLSISHDRLYAVAVVLLTE